MNMVLELHGRYEIMSSWPVKAIEYVCTRRGIFCEEDMKQGGNT